MYRSILVPLDGSAHAEHAIPAALEIARATEAALCVVHVRPASTERPPQKAGHAHGRAAAEASGSAAWRYLAAWRDRLTRETGVQATAELFEGPVVRTLCDRAAALGADLIVMASAGAGTPDGAGIGSVTEGMVRLAGAPTLVVRSGPLPADPSRRRGFRHVLIPLDGSAAASQIIEPVRKLQRAGLAQCTLLTVVTPCVDGWSPAAVPDALDWTDVERRRARAASFLARVGERLGADGLTVRSRVLLDRYPATAILRYADDNAVDAIAMATRGRGGPSRILLGGVAAKVLRGAGATMFVFRPVAGARFRGLSGREAAAVRARVRRPGRSRGAPETALADS